MFEKWRIKEHMEVVDSASQHVGTVDEIEDSGGRGRIKLTRSDSSDSAHHYLDIDSVERIEDGRVYLKAGTSLPQREKVTVGGSMSGGGLGTGATAGYGGDTSNRLPRESDALFGTSGHGTGMGGSGSGVEN